MYFLQKITEKKTTISGSEANSQLAGQQDLCNWLTDGVWQDNVISITSCKVINVELFIQIRYFSIK